MPQSIYDPGFAAFGGGTSGSVLHPLVLGALILIGLLVFLLPRKYILVPLFLGILLIPYSQNFYIGGQHLFVYRVLLLLGWGRLLATGMTSSEDMLPGGFGTLDKLFTVWATFRALATVLLFMQAGAIPGQVAFLWDALGGYFLFRCLIRNEEDILRVLKAFAVVAVVASVGMVYEQMTHQNLFAFLGGVRPAPEIRNGKIRSQAMFAHALLAGAFGSTMFPLFIWLWKRGKSWFFGILGTAAATVMTFASSTSTPIMTLLGALLVFCLWPMRKNMRLVRWGIVGGFVVLQLFMKAPVWFVVAHIDLSGGSTGWDRAELIDNFLRHSFDWLLIGTHNNVNWGYDMWDQCNQFVLEGESGGLVGFVCFIAMFKVCFRKIGNARKIVEGDPKKEWLIWIFGAALFAQVMAYMGIDYFDQTKFVWYALLVMISAVTLAPSAELAPVSAESKQFVPHLGMQSPAISLAGTKNWNTVLTRSR
jgi:hypothetical protein